MKTLSRSPDNTPDSSKICGVLNVPIGVNYRNASLGPLYDSSWTLWRTGRENNFPLGGDNERRPTTNKFYSLGSEIMPDVLCLYDNLGYLRIDQNDEVWSAGVGCIMGRCGITPSSTFRV